MQLWLARSVASFGNTMGKEWNELKRLNSPPQSHKLTALLIKTGLNESGGDGGGDNIPPSDIPLERKIAN